MSEGAYEDQNKLVLLRRCGRLWQHTDTPLNLPPNASHLGWDGQSFVLFTPERIAGKSTLCMKKCVVQMSQNTKAVGGSYTDTHTHTHSQRLSCWQDEVVCCFKSGDNCQQPQISKMTSAVKLALQFWTQAYILAWTSRTQVEAKCTRMSGIRAHYAKQQNCAWSRKEKMGKSYSLIFFPQLKMAA